MGGENPALVFAGWPDCQELAQEGVDPGSLAGRVVEAMGSQSRLDVGIAVLSPEITDPQVLFARAGSAMEQAKGLMFRTKLGPDEGMIFPMSPPRGASFWMKNTVISLDLIFIAPDGRISNIAANAVPYNLAPLTSIGPVKGVLEIPGGRAAELGIAPGDKVAW